MNLFRDFFKQNNAPLAVAALLVVGFIAAPRYSYGQQADANGDPRFRVEKIRVDGGAELITIFARRHNSRDVEMPLVSILRDTLDDANPENDRLRYVWNLSYTKPTALQKLSAFVPFLYARTTNKRVIGKSPPPPLIDMSPNDNGPWNRFFGIVFRRIVLTKVSAVIRAPILQYRQNKAEYRRAAIAQTQAVLSLYQPSFRETLLSDSESKDIQARLSLTDKIFGSRVQSENLTRVYEKEIAGSKDVRNQNWELLRQYSEQQGLYFDPIKMPDGSARHALIWADAAEINTNADKEFNARFLNIKKPWNDRKLSNWKGFSQTRWFNEADREVAADTPQSQARTLIPLAVYGLDYPKIPALLVDFRSNGNVKRREMSRRVLHDVTSNVLQLGQFSGLPYFFGRHGYDYFTAKRGVDVNQPSRLRAIAELKLLLAMDATLDEDLKAEIARRLEYTALNPLENDLEAEANLAHRQYENLIAYAKRPDGLAKRIENDRRQEMTKLVHSGRKRLLFSLGHFFSFGRYTHREKPTPELFAQMDVRRQLNHHERYLREVAYNSARPEIDSDVDAVKRSLRFVSQNGAGAKEKTTRSIMKIFSVTQDEEMRDLSLAGLYRIDSSAAKKQLLAVYSNNAFNEKWRSLSARYLKLALEEGQQISKSDARTISVIEAN